jgi:hypothetical protein
VRIAIIGASFWTNAGVCLTEFLKARGYDPQISGSRGNPLGLIVRFGEQIPMAQSDMESTKKLLKNQWDYVVFMGHSSEPFSDTEDNVAERFTKFIKILQDNAQGNPKYVATSTWLKAEPRTPERWATVHKLYTRVVKEHGFLLAPSGAAFELVNKERPDLMLYTHKYDGHAGLLGQYLNSCVVFTVVTGESPIGLPISVPTIDPGSGEPMELDPATARYLQTAAWRVCHPYEKTPAPPGPSPVSETKIIFHHNPAGRVVKKESFHEEKLVYYATYEYTPAGQLKEETLWDTRKGVKSRKQYTYNAKNLLSKIELIWEARAKSQKKGAEKAAKFFSHHYAYDDQSRLTEYQHLDPDGKLISKQTYSHNEDNRIVEIKNYSATGDQDNTAKNRYDVKNRLVEQINQSPEGKFKNQIKYIYDDKDHLMEEQTLDAEQKVAQKTVYTRDGQGREVTEKVYQMNPASDSDELMLVKSIKYEYRD